MKTLVCFCFCMYVKTLLTGQVNFTPILRRAIQEQVGLDSINTTLKNAPYWTSKKLDQFLLRDTLFLVWMQPVRIEQMPSMIDGIPVRSFTAPEFHHYLRRATTPKKLTIFIAHCSIRIKNDTSVAYLDFETQKISLQPHSYDEHEFNFNDWNDANLYKFKASPQKPGSNSIDLKPYGFLYVSIDSLKTPVQLLLAPSKWINIPVVLIHQKKLLEYIFTLYWKRWFNIQSIDLEQKKVKAKLKKVFWKDINLKEIRKSPLPIGIAWLHEVYLGKTESYVEYWVGYIDCNKKGKRQKKIVFNEPFRIHLHFDKKQ